MSYPQRAKATNTATVPTPGAPRDDQARPRPAGQELPGQELPGQELPATTACAGWAAELHCRFERRGDKTVLASRQHRGPLLVQRPFYPEGAERCHVYLIHPPGGVAAGDHLRQELSLSGGARALVTTPAAGKFYRSRGRLSAQPARQQTVLSLGAGSQLEWLPQETILFAGAHVELTTQVELQDDAGFLGWEMLALGRPACDETFDKGLVRQRFELWRDGKPLFLERAQYRGGDAVLTAPFGLAGHSVSATMLCVHPDPAALVTVARAVLNEVQEADIQQQYAVTALSGLAVCRYLGPWAQSARRVLERVWRAWRPIAFGVDACPPRIWST